jgi:hypothetical protein
MPTALARTYPPNAAISKKGSMMIKAYWLIK